MAPMFTGMEFSYTRIIERWKYVQRNWEGILHRPYMKSNPSNKADRWISELLYIIFNLLQQELSDSIKIVLVGVCIYRATLFRKSAEISFDFFLNFTFDRKKN